MKKNKPMKKNIHGQSTLEFILTLILVFGILGFYIRLSLLMAYGSYAQYSTFMAARAYLSGGQDFADQTRRAGDVMRLTLGALKPTSLFPGPKGGSIKDSTEIGFLKAPDGSVAQILPTSEPGYQKRELSWSEGVRYTFRGKVFVLPLLGDKPDDPESEYLELQSQSWLGREPTDGECNSQSVGVKDNGGC